jgi:WD40 repeat protein
MKVTRVELVAVKRTMDRRGSSGPFDRDRFLISNNWAHKLDQMNREKHDYVLRHLVMMRLAGGDVDGVVRLLADFDFLAAKAAALLVPNLLQDYEAAIALTSEAAARDLQRIRRAFELGRFLLEDDPGQLPEQLLGRLDPVGSEGIGRLLERASSYKAEPWLQPLAGRLTAPDSPLVQTLVGPPGDVDQIAVFPDSRTCISASGTLLVVWDLESRLDKLTLTGDDGDVTDLLVSPDSRFAVLAMRSETIQVWDLHKGELRHRLTGHESAVLTLAMTLEAVCCRVPPIAPSGCGISNGASPWEFSTPEPRSMRSQSCQMVVTCSPAAAQSRA